MTDKPICYICNEEILANNPLQVKDGFAHRQCWINEANKKIQTIVSKDTSHTRKLSENV